MDFMENTEIVVGTYENHLLGYKIVTDPVNEVCPEANIYRSIQDLINAGPDLKR